MENILCVLRQINACLGLYESEKLAKSGMTFAQVFLLNEILAMEPPKIFSHELCKRVGLAKSSVSRTLKELKKNGYINMRVDKADNRKKHIVLTEKAMEVQEDVKAYVDDLNHCLFQKIPQRGQREIEASLRTILGNIQQETDRLPASAEMSTTQKEEIELD